MTKATGRRWRWRHSGSPTSTRCAPHWSTNSSNWPPIGPRAAARWASRPGRTPRSTATRRSAAPPRCLPSTATPGCSTTRWTSGRSKAQRRSGRGPGSRWVRPCSACCVPTTRYPPIGFRRRRNCLAGRPWPRVGGRYWTPCWPGSPPGSWWSTCVRVPMRHWAGCRVRWPSMCWPSTPTAGARWSATSTRRTRGGWPGHWRRAGPNPATPRPLP